MRNHYSMLGHGHDLYGEPAADHILSIFIEAGDIVGAYLLNLHFRYTNPADNKRPNYVDQPDFNDWLDEIYPKELKFELGEYVTILSPSKVLFYSDLDFYNTALSEYLLSKVEGVDK